MDENMTEKAKELGRLVGQTDEYKALSRARQRLNDDRELVELINGMEKLEKELSASVRQGEAPPDDVREKYEQTASELQSSSVYQGLVAAQSNFDKVLRKVNEHIAKGMESGSESKIIMPS